MLALSGLSVLAQSSGAKAGNAENGKKLFAADGCYECHGLQGQGGSAAPVGSYGPRLAPPRIPVEAIRLYIRHPSGSMPPYAAKVLSDAQIDDIYAFLKTIPAPPPVKDIPLLNQ
ncbi:MAG TPA: cytochrome c [Bryobacteraceae bacterium]|nr:cytochrome c [Bryobacteraceae bacterium]